MRLPEQSETKSLERVYQEASQWVRLVNTIIWTMGTLVVPVAFGLLGVALNKSSGLQFDVRGKIVLGVGSVFLFGFWVYASRIYKKSVDVARKVLIEIEKKWMTDEEEKGLRFYQLQSKILDKQTFGLFKLAGDNSYRIDFGLGSDSCLAAMTLTSSPRAVLLLGSKIILRKDCEVRVREFSREEFLVCLTS